MKYMDNRSLKNLLYEQVARIGKALGSPKRLEMLEMLAQGEKGQVRQALLNVVAVLREAGARPEHIARMTWYVTDKREYLARGREVGSAYREVIGSHYAAMSAVQVSALMEDRAKVEIEVTAVVPSPGS